MFESQSRLHTPVHAIAIAIPAMDDAQPAVQLSVLPLSDALDKSCGICMTALDDTQVHTLQGCGHQFCRQCLRDYVAVSLDHGNCRLRCHFLSPTEPGSAAPSAPASTEGGVSPAAPAGSASATTPGLHRHGSSLLPPSCGTPLTEGDVELLVTGDQLQRWRRFVANRDLSMRQCPRCDHSQRGCEEQPAMQCEQCGQEYCFAHSTAHIDQTCAEFERSQQTQERAAMEVIDAIAVRCPGCRVAVEKGEGCNHMHCPACGMHFCYLCGQPVSDFALPSHYAFWNVQGCPNRQLVPNARPWTRTELRAFRCLSLLALCLVGPPAAVVATVIFVLFFPALWFAATPSLPLWQKQAVVLPVSTGTAARPRSALVQRCSNLGSIFLFIFTVVGYLVMGFAAVFLCLLLLPLFIAAAPCVGLYWWSSRRRKGLAHTAAEERPGSPTEGLSAV